VGRETLTETDSTLSSPSSDTVYEDPNHPIMRSSRFAVLALGSNSPYLPPILLGTQITRRSQADNLSCAPNLKEKIPSRASFFDKEKRDPCLKGTLLTSLFPTPLPPLGELTLGDFLVYDTSLILGLFPPILHPFLSNILCTSFIQSMNNGFSSSLSFHYSP